MSETQDGQVLLVAVPLRHLGSATELGVDGGPVVLPAGGPGDLDRTPPGTQVRVIALGAGETDVPAVTWGATFVARVPHEAGDPWPPGIPPTWASEHAPPETTAHPPTPIDEDDDPDDEDVVGPQSFFEVTGLAPLPRHEWIFANELVAKQQRGGRTFVPRTPRLVVVID